MTSVFDAKCLPLSPLMFERSERMLSHRDRHNFFSERESLLRLDERCKALRGTYFVLTIHNVSLHSSPDPDGSSEPLYIDLPTPRRVDIVHNHLAFQFLLSSTHSVLISTWECFRCSLLTTAEHFRPRGSRICYFHFLSLCAEMWLFTAIIHVWLGDWGEGAGMFTVLVIVT